MVRIRVREQQLARMGEEFKADGRAGGGVDGALIDDFEDAVFGHVQVEANFVLDYPAGSRIAHAVGVVYFRVVDGEGVGFLHDQTVGVPVERGVDAQAEEVLVVRREDSGGDARAVGDFVLLFQLRGDGGEDARGADFEVERGVLPEVEGEDVLVVRNGDDGLQDEDARAGDDGVARAEIRVFPENAVVLLVAADDVGELDGGARGVVVPRVEVLDRAQAVAAETEVVGVDSRAVVAQIESRFARVWGARVAVGHEHFRQREAVEQAAVVVADVVQGQAFAVVEAKAKGPFLPGDLLAGDTEGGAGGLDDLEGFGGGAWAGAEGGMIFAQSGGVDSPSVEGALGVVDAFVRGGG